MITVFCVCIGTKYSPVYVKLLRAMVARNLSTPHRFVCVTDYEFFDDDRIEVVRPPVPWAGWWQKLALFKLADGPSLFFDLDVVITGSLDYLVEYTQHEFAAPANWAQSGHGGIQSSVMAWNGTWKEPSERFRYDVDSKRLWGDQEYLTEIRGDNFVKLPGIVSYKYHCREQGRVPKGASVVVFHGKPDPHEVGDEWVKTFRYI